MNKKKALIALAVLVLVGGFVGFNVVNARNADDGTGIPRTAVPVHWAYPSVQTIISSVSARGNVELRDRTIMFPNTQAQIVEVHVSVGDIVHVGDLLITYDESALDLMHDQLAEAHLALRSAELGLAATRIAPADTEILTAENQIEQARTSITNIEIQIGQFDLQISHLEDNIQTAKDTLANVQRLFDNDVAPRTELDSAMEAVRRLEDQLEILVAQRDAAAVGLAPAREGERLAIAQLEAVRTRNAQPQAVNQAQVQQVAIDRANLTIAQIERNIAEFEKQEFATAAGTVLNVFVESGEFSVSSRPLVEVADISDENLVIVVHVPENDAGNIELGQDVEISGGAIGNHRYTGYIELIHPLVAPRQMGTTVETVVTVEISAVGTTRLRAGNTVDADIVTNIHEDTLVVPLMSTVSAGGGETFVFVVNDESILERRDIELGEFSDMYIEALGILPNDRVVASPTIMMYEGMQVRPIQPLH